MPRATVRLFIASALTVIAVSGLSACSDEHTSLPDKTATAQKVIGDLINVSTAEIDDIKRMSGIVTTRDMGEAVARIPGVLVTLNVREGDTVSKGQIIGVVKDQRLNFEASAYAATATQAEADYKRIKTLYDKGIYTKARLEQAESVWKAAQAQRAAAGELAGQGVIRAPASGVVVKADVPAGAVVMAGQSVATVTAGPRVVRLQLPEQQARALRVGQLVDLDANGVTATGTISQIYPSVENGQVVADVTPSGLEQVLVGERVITSLSLGKRQGIQVPTAYVATRYGLDYVRLIAPDRTFSEIPVQTAPLSGGQVEILSGLKDGDRLAPYGAVK
ncbi:efflux RND transporter periplasmic adaptor subunit [Asticcacaulis sp. BYS171W]|uniref:Efflux RND transporter periplasmic adaptor subunit n=1 Tax=Asticcacaulis aquaticus TaxID=2984212 RepID=A0ABT5HWQ2_9CAUL|nr:efflux RND transporter periplasmic adaptor subunit [Asticcacaulis aquaticus]MDC7684506.1 efflux RND transporter periplasmic adaptor subunit [Asticcacaulis aquaticus]